MPGVNHKATYARDKRLGGYIIRVEGPHASKFADREVTVTRRNGSENTEQLTDLIWSGTDEDSGQSIALYYFEPSAKEPEDVEF